MVEHAHILTLAEWARGVSWRASLLHSSAKHALIWVTRGQGIAVIDGVRRGVGVHNAVVIPAGTMFSLELGKQGFGLVCLIPTSGPIMMPDLSQHLRIRDVQAQTELTAILDAMQREQNTKRAFMDEALNAQAGLLTVWLRRAMIEHGTPDGKKPAAVRLVNAYAALVEREFRQGKTMAEFASQLGVTPTHLTRSCRHCAGLTAADLLTQRVLYDARTMLEDSSEAIRHIAALLGFTSAAYFSRFILHHTGKSPSDLRKQSRAIPRVSGR